MSQDPAKKIIMPALKKKYFKPGKLSKVSRRKE